MPVELELDPFGYVASYASRVEGLGGPDRPPDEAYVCHTAYVEVAQGRAHFTIQFTNLRARRGSLVLRVHMLRDDPAAHATLANSDRIALNRLVAQGGRHQIRFEGFREMRYALVARIADDTDAQADALTITLDRPAVAADPADIAIDGRATRFGTGDMAPTPLLMTMTRPTFAQPVSQPATIAQTREPAFAAQRAAVARSADPLGEWQDAFVLQALQSYGMLHEGAEGVGIGPGASPLPRAVAGFGTRLLYLSPDAEGDADPSVERLRNDLQSIPRDIVSRDFLYTTRLPDLQGSVPTSLRVLEETMNCLRPGGIAVHAFDYDLDGAAGGMMAGRVAPLIRADIERLALNLVSRGHEVAQLRLDGGRPLRAARGSPRSAFGLIVRRGAAVF